MNLYTKYIRERKIIIGLFTIPLIKYYTFVVRGAKIIFANSILKETILFLGVNFYLCFYPSSSITKVLPKVLHNQSNLDIVMMIAKYIWLLCGWLKTMSFRVNCVDCIHVYTCNFLMQSFYGWKGHIIKRITFFNSEVIIILIHVFWIF